MPRRCPIAPLPTLLALLALPALTQLAGCDRVFPYGARPPDVGVVDAPRPEGPPLRDARRERPLDGRVVTSAGWQWEHPWPQGNTLHAIWGNGPDDVWAVGERGTIVRYDQSKWSSSSIGGMSLRGVWGTSGSDVWIVGEGFVGRYQGGPGPGVPVVVESPPAGVSSFAAVRVFPDAPGAPFVAARDEAGGGLYRRDPLTKKWASIPPPSATAVVPRFLALAGGGAADLVVVGALGNAAAAYRYPGQGQLVEIGSPTGLPPLRAVWSNKTTTWVVGADKVWEHEADWLLAWPAVSGPTLWGMHGVGDGVFAVGDKGTSGLHGASGWVPLLGVTGRSLRGVWGDPGGIAYAVGEGGVILRRDAAISPNASFTSISGPDGDLLAISARAAGAHAVGGGAVLRRWGTTWTLVPWLAAGNKLRLTGVWTVGPSEAWAVADTGEIVRCQASCQTVNAVKAVGPLRAISGSDASNVWAVGDSGIPMHYDGSTWQETPLVGWPMLAVWTDGPARAFVVGDKGRWAMWHGAVWTPGEVPQGTGHLRAVAGAPTGGGGQVFVTGDLGIVWTYDLVARTWDPGSTPDSTMGPQPQRPLHGLWTDGQRLVAVGLGGRVYQRATGGGWTWRPPPTDNDLFAVTGDGGTLFVAGAFGTILAAPLD